MLASVIFSGSLGVRVENQALGLLRSDVTGIMLGTVFVFMGLAACALAAVRGRGGVRILVWFGIFSTMYGVRLLAEVPAGFHVLPQSVWFSRPYAIAIITYLILVPALLFWLELSLGALRRLLQGLVVAALVVGIVGVCSAFIAKSPYEFIAFNNVVAIVFILGLAVANAVPRLAKKFLVITSPVSVISTMVLAVAVLHANLRTFLRLPAYSFFEPIAFAVFVLTLGWIAAEKIFADERRLLAVENELAIAREIQTSILPNSVPDLDRLIVSAVYRPMTAVAGDFYEFVLMDRNRTGFLVADVSGHGVPAALIAGMIKVAMQSVVPCASVPPEVLRGLNRILSGQLHGQFVSAAYLWLDTEKRKALYSAAGHPPLLRWRDGRLERIESNGLLFGVMPEADFPVCDMPINPGDRFLLYTDGVTEPENANGDSFGDRQLEQVVRDNRSRPASDLADQLLSEINRWQPPSTTQQDDITLIVIDVV